MTDRVASIFRKKPRGSAPERPVKFKQGYRLRPPGLTGNDRNRIEHAVHVATLEEVADLLTKGHSVWVGAEGQKRSLVSLSGLEIRWA